MSIGIERERERHGHPHTEEAAGGSIAHAVHQIDELHASIAKVRRIHHPDSRPGALGLGRVCAECALSYPCATIRALPDEPHLGGDAA